MRYIGSKSRVIGFLDDAISSCVEFDKETVFADLFAGTTVVAQHFKKLGCRIICNDYMAFSYILQVALIKNNRSPSFNGLVIGDYGDVLSHLNSLKSVRGFFYKNYCMEGSANGDFKRNYFSMENACKIDSILKEIKIWKVKKMISFVEESVLRASLIEAITKVSNISGTYGAFLSGDDPRKFKSMKVKKLKFISSHQKHSCFNEDIMTLIDRLNGDILYLDPPYNQRQYPPYYHILETVSLDDNPPIYGKTGRRPYKDKLSPFCIKEQVGKALRSLVNRARFEHIFISYNTEGLLHVKDIEEILSMWGKTKIYFYGYRRYRSNNRGKVHNNVREILLYVHKKGFIKDDKNVEKGETQNLSTCKW